MAYPTTRLVFDRKKTATREKVALVQIEILYERKRKYVSTGVKVYKDQWTDKSHVVNRPDMMLLNKRLDEQKGRIDEYLNTIISDGERFDFDTFGRWLKGDEERRRSFLEWMEERIDSRGDLREGTRRNQRKTVNALRDFGRIVDFSELTPANITKFDDYLHRRGIKQTSVWGYHKTLKTYVREALRLELIEKDPYANMKVERGKSEWGRYLTIEELDTMMDAKMPTESIDKVRDLFVLQCLTGMAYADLMAFDFSKVTKKGDTYVLHDERRKTGVGFTVVLLPKAMEILRKYDYKLPNITNAQYNMRLKVVADACGIEKPISSHYGRRTCGMVLLNKGFPIEVVAKVLGHSNIQTTQEAYARILDETVEREFERKFGV